MQTLSSSEISRSLHQGLEQCDVNAMLSLYADDAELTIIDRDHTPSSPRTLKGKAALKNYFQDVLNRPMTHHIDQEVLGDGRMAFTDSCQYQDGTRVFTAAIATLEDGRIVSEVDVQEWDENV